jgi:bacterioferritin-associated ferredoxin
MIAPMRDKRAAITDEEVRAVLATGVTKAKETSNQTLRKVRSAIGID